MKLAVIIIDDNGVIESIMESFSNAFEKLGHEVLRIHNRDRNFLNNLKNIAESYNPDFVLSYGYTGISMDVNKEFLFRKFNIPLIMLFYDCPLVNLNEEFQNEFKNYYSYYFQFIWDDYFIEILKGSGYKNINKVLLAADTEKFFPFDYMRPLNSISFAGVIGEGYENSYTSYESINRFIDEVIERKNIDIWKPTLNICFDLFRDKRYEFIKEIWQVNNKLFWNAIYQIIVAKGSVVLRRNVLGNINNKEIHLYGTNNGENFKFIYHNSIPHGILMSKEYQKYKINLNISSLQLETAINNRIFDIFGSKAFVLSDYKVDVEKIFRNCYEEITFKNKEELNRKIHYYLEHEQERLDIVDYMYNNIICNHTYKNRAEEIINIFKNNV